MKEIELSEVRRLIDYDCTTGKFKWRVNRGHMNRGLVAGTMRDGGYIEIMVFGKHLRAHRLAWFIYYGEWPDKEIDHINGDRTDNRIVNLREATRRKNAQNMQCHRDGGVCGVQRTPRGRYQARAYLDKRLRHLGVFDTEIEAHAAYKEAVKSNA